MYISIEIQAMVTYASKASSFVSYAYRQTRMRCSKNCCFFPSTADRAYTLFNGAALGKHDARLQLRIFPPGDTKEPEAASGILHVKNLPGYTTNSMLYDLFRPFGPMSLCKIIVEQGSTFKGTALVQYFRSEDADKAVTMVSRAHVKCITTQN